MLRKNKSDPESAAFWDYVERTAEIVRRWPAWRRGEMKAKDQEREEMQAKIRSQRAELARLQAICKQRSTALDAMHYIWCTGCKEGANRCGEAPDLTDEIVAEAERIVKRMRKWLSNRKFDEFMKGVSDEEKARVDSALIAGDRGPWLDLLDRFYGPNEDRAEDVSLKDRIQGEMEHLDEAKKRISEGLARYRQGEKDAEAFFASLDLSVLKEEKRGD